MRNDTITVFEGLLFKDKTFTTRHQNIQSNLLTIETYVAVIIYQEEISIFF